MAYNENNLAPVGNSSYGLSGVGSGDGNAKGTFRVWSYTTQDTQATVNTQGYFNDASNILGLGDKIEVMHLHATNANKTIVGFTSFRVLSISDTGVVDVNNGTTESISDTD